MKFLHNYFVLVLVTSCITTSADKPLLHMPWKPLVLGEHEKYKCSQSAQSLGDYASHTINGVDEYTIDIAMPYGTPVVASANGTAYEFNTNTGYGKYVKVQHNEFYSIYAHLSRIKVVDGQEVVSGQTIGYSGNTGCGSCGYHLHTGLFKGDASLPDYEYSVLSYYFIGTADNMIGKLTSITDIECLYPLESDRFYYSVNFDQTVDKECINNDSALDRKVYLDEIK